MTHAVPPAHQELASSADLPVSSTSSAVGHHRGRSSRFTAQLAEGICALVQCEGISDTQAGLLLGIPKATLSRWKAAHEEFAFQLDQARAFFQREHVQRVLAACRPDGSPDWRASAWLLQRMFPEQYGSINRRSSVDEDHTHIEEAELAGSSQSSSTSPEIPLQLPAAPEIAEKQHATELKVSEDDAPIGSVSSKIPEVSDPIRSGRSPFLFDQAEVEAEDDAEWFHQFRNSD